MPREKRKREGPVDSGGLCITPEPAGGWPGGGPRGPRALEVTDPDRLGLLHDGHGRLVRDADGHYETLASLKARG